MSTAVIPAAVGLGGSIFSGISGKGAARRQERLAREFLDLQRPLLQAQTEGARFGLAAARPLIGDSTATLRGAGQAARDLQRFWAPLAFGGRSAIDKFLSPERRSINEGYRATINNLTRFAPRGGGRITAMADADRARQGQLSDLTFGARREGASQMANLANLLSSIGGTQGGVGTSLLGAGLSGGQQGFNLLNQQQNRAFGASQAASQNWGNIAEGLGDFLSDLLNNRRGSSTRDSNREIYGTGPYDS